MKVLWLANVPAPYRVNFFNELGKHIDLTVLFEKRTSDIRDKSWLDFEFKHFRGVFLHGKKTSVSEAMCFDVIKYIKKNIYDFIVVTDFTSPTGMLAIEYMRMRGINYWLESDGGFAKSGVGFKESIKRHFIRGAQLYLSTGKLHDEYYLKYGASKDKIVRYPFTSIENSDILEKPISKKEKLEIRKKHDIVEEKVILTVGQFVPRKGFDLLLKACENLDDNVGVYFVGGTATEEYWEIVNKYNLKNVHFVGFKQKADIIEYYKAADFFVLPTREDVWGLVINEAMAYGLPVITTTKCIAGTELIANGENGYIVENENVHELTNRICELLVNESSLEEMKTKALYTARQYTLEKMVQTHLDLFCGWKA